MTDGCAGFFTPEEVENSEYDESMEDDESEMPNPLLILFVALLDAITSGSEDDFIPEYLGAFYMETGIHVGPQNLNEYAETVNLTISYRHMMTSWGRDYDFGIVSIGFLVNF